MLYLQGELVDKIYYVQRGTVALFRATTEESAFGRATALRGPESILGLEALSGGRYQHSAQAESDVVLCVASTDLFMDWLGPVDTPSTAVLRQVLRAEEEDVELSSARPQRSDERVAVWLLKSHEGEGALPRKVLADLLGMRPETLSRVLGRLSAAGAIAHTRTSVRILDRARLCDIAGVPFAPPGSSKS
jgi:CRP-like cAMP-binding protein